MSRAWLLPPAHTHVWVLQAPLPRPRPSAPAPRRLHGDRSSLVLTANTLHSHTHPMGTPCSWYPQKPPARPAAQTWGLLLTCWCKLDVCWECTPISTPPTVSGGHRRPCSSWHQTLGCDPWTSSHQLAPSHWPLHHPGPLGFHPHHLQSLGLLQFLECPSTIVTDLVCLLSSGLSSLNTSIFYFSHLFFL